MSGDEVRAAGLPPTDALPPRPRPGDRRPPRPVHTGAVSAIAGAALSVLAVGLGIVALNWVSGPPTPPTVITESVASRPVVPGPLLSPSPRQSPPPPSAAPGSGRTGLVLTAPSPPAAATPVPTPTPGASASPPSPVVPVTVLNNSRRAGLAARAAERFRAGGWPVALVGNFRGRIPVTTVYYDPGLEASAQAFARRFDGIARVRPRFPTLPARGVVVVVTREFAP